MIYIITFNLFVLQFLFVILCLLYCLTKFCGDRTHCFHKSPCFSYSSFLFTIRSNLLSVSTYFSPFFHRIRFVSHLHVVCTGRFSSSTIKKKYYICVVVIWSLKKVLIFFEPQRFWCGVACYNDCTVQRELHRSSRIVQRNIQRWEIILDFQ